MDVLTACQVKCDRGLPYCGWCLRNEQICDYKERKKPGLRAGYGRELESRLGEFCIVGLSPPLVPEPSTVDFSKSVI